MRWIVEMTIRGSVQAVKVAARSRGAAKDAAEKAHPEAERIWGAYTLREWQRLISEVAAWRREL